MQVIKNSGPATETPAREFTLGDMEQDFEFEMAQRITRSLFQDGLISEEELQRITVLNIESFKPYLSDLM